MKDGCGVLRREQYDERLDPAAVAPGDRSLDRQRQPALPPVGQPVTSVAVGHSGLEAVPASVWLVTPVPVGVEAVKLELLSAWKVVEAELSWM